MFLKKKTFLCYVLLLGLLTFPMGSAAADNEIQFDKIFTSFTPIFMSGHDGDLNYIEGFTGTGDIYLDGTKIGTLTAAATLINPPMSFTERYEYGQMKVVNTITGLGTFEVNGMVLFMGSSSVTTDFESTLVWTGSISNGTGSLADLVGLSAGNATANMVSFTASGSELILYRLGY